jgi:hypothetical protein
VKIHVQNQFSLRPTKGTEMATKTQCFVIVSDSGESWALNGDNQNADDKNELLPSLLADGWKVESVTPGSGAKDDTSYWLVLVTK